jgi:hypothetical protein
MPTAICFIEKKRKQRPVSKGSNEWESGNWDVSQAKAASLVGKRIYFHEKQAEPSYFGGVIVSFQVLPANHSESPGRIVFTFTRDEHGMNFIAGPDGWGNEQKTIP